MPFCSSCGRESDGGFAFCPHCAAPFASEPAREQRKTVTVLFCDLVGSTALGESVDPEALRALLALYFRRMKGIVEAHGGTVEKFIGDAVMAVFGIPVVHEDDALRAVRAALEMREAWPELGVEGRIGVNTGEVVTGTAERLVTGDAVNVAARLERAAEPGQVWLGTGTLRLLRDAVEVEQVEALTLKGKSEPVPAWRLLAVGGGLERRFSAPMVGRETELARLRAAFAQAVHDRSCQLFMMFGTAGVGKSRLAAEFLAGLDARRVRGRCLSYGEGITYWPVVEVIRQLDTLPADEAAVAALRSLLGESDAGTSAEELAWAFRKLLEQEAQEQPLVCVLDDLHWGEPTLLDLVERVADLSRDAPIMLLCMARPELLERRPGWAGGKSNATTALLKPLDATETDQLLDALGGVEGELRDRIAAAAEGNPLFLEEMLALLRESGGVEVKVPPTIQALLAARLDQLEPGERSVLERGAIEGRVFHRSAVQALSDGETQLHRRLVSLVRKDLVLPDKPQLPGDEAYRFRHLLIRDAAYRSLSKATRADLHERFAAWLERTAAERVREYEEIVGYHLEQAYRCRIDLGSVDEELQGLGARASQRLESAGRRALARGDLHAAIGLLERATSLCAADGVRRAVLLPELGAALIEAGRLSEAERVLGEAMLVAAEAEDECAESRVLVKQQFLHLLQVTEGGTDRAASSVERVLPIFKRHDDHLGLCSARRLEAWLYWNEASAAAAAEAWEQAAAHAGRAGDDHARAEILTWIASSLWFGPTPVVEAIRRCEEIRSEVSGHPESEALTLRHLGGLHAMDGRFDLARSLLATSNAVFEDLGLTLNAATSHNEAVMEMLAGDPAAAEASLRSGFEALKQMGEQAFLSTTAAFLARAVFAQERDDEAEDLAQLSAKLTATGDLLTQVLWRGVQARILARRGRLEEAEALAREAVALAEQTDFLVYRGDAFVDLAHVLQDSGRRQEAAAAAAEGLHLHEQKGNLITAGKIRSDLGVLL
jgi:class 3 adenylate cyclase/predicted ATPase